MTEASSRNESLLRGVEALKEYLTRAIGGTRWGARIRDRLVITLYYLLRTATLGSPGRIHRTGPLTFHYAIGDALLRVPDGILLCRRGTDDLDIANPGYEPDVARLLQELAPRTFLDVGAHIGKYVLMAARRASDPGLVIAVEPDADNFDALRRNVERNRLPNVRLLNVACWNANGTVRLYQSVSENKGRHSVTDITGSWAEVPARTLDSIVESAGGCRIDAIMLDVEGAEPEVLEGGRATLVANPGIVVIFEAMDERHLQRCQSILATVGLHVSPIDSRNYVASRSSPSFRPAAVPEASTQRGRLTPG